MSTFCAIDAAAAVPDTATAFLDLSSDGGLIPVNCNGTK